MFNKKYLLIIGLMITTVVLLAACASPTPTETPTAVVTSSPTEAPTMAPVEMISLGDLQPETCIICHPEAGDKHQASYDELYQDGVIKVTDVTYAFTPAPDTTVVTFKMTKNGMPISGASVANINIYFANYTGTAFEGAGRLSLKGKLTYNAATGVTTSTLVEKKADESGYVDYTNLSTLDGIFMVYGYDGQVGSLPARIRMVKYPYAAVLEKNVDYLSPANNDGCELCHTDPYLKHGTIYGQINGDPETDFLACKVCHLDNGEGGHLEWQLLVDDPVKAVEWLSSDEDLSIFSPEQLAQLEYKTTLMNDVHMSHAMEFPYPQSMANCTTCHEAKLDVILTDANFKLQTCKSCHPMTGPEEGTQANRAPALAAIVPHDIAAEVDCTTCHADGGVAPVFNAIHSGYDKQIYADATGTRYSDVFTVTVDEASLAGNLLTIKFNAVKNVEVTSYTPADIIPTVLISLYGYDTKDFIVGGHSRDADDNRLLEFQINGVSTNPRFTVVSAANGSWEVTVDLSMWADMIADGTVKRAEIGVMPMLADIVGEIDSRANGETDDTVYAVVAPSRTFDLVANAFDDEFYPAIVKVTDGCNTCHEALGTTFHSPDRGGNIVVCRMCHTTENGGSHLEMQSRSIDSYVHAIHSFQAFDSGDIDFTDPVAALEYHHHIEFPYPKHGSQDCESCHEAGMYNVPDQSKSLPGVLSAADEWTVGRKIGAVPSIVTGPAARACGGCHRAEYINEDNVVNLTALNIHTKSGGYAITNGEGVWSAVVESIMSLFK